MIHQPIEEPEIRFTITNIGGRGKWAAIQTVSTRHYFDSKDDAEQFADEVLNAGSSSLGARSGDATQVAKEPPATAPDSQPAEPLGSCLVHGDYWTDDCPKRGRGEC